MVAYKSDPTKEPHVEGQRLSRENLLTALSLLGDVLEVRGLAYELAVIGGSALLLSGSGERTTRDVDVVGIVDVENRRVVGLPFSDDFERAASDVAEQLAMASGWINAGPRMLAEFGLPDGFVDRCERHAFRSLGVWIAARIDQIFFKLFAAVDQGPNSRHASDLLSLSPTLEELDAAAKWCRTHDPSVGFAEMLDEAVAFFKGAINSGA